MTQALCRKRIQEVIWLLFSLSLLMPGMRPLYAQQQDPFEVKSASTQLNETVYFLNAVFEINLPPYISSAFEQGFDLPLAMEVNISRKRAFWFDEELVTIKQKYRIQYHSILDTVSVLNVNSGSHVYFSTLDEALAYLSVLLNFPMLDNNTLDPDEHYRARLKFGVDTAELPTPLKSSSLWENDWNLVSDDYAWEINP